MKLGHKKFNKIVILTGAGISAESGIKTFRDSNGLWENHQIEEVATPEAFQKNPQLVWKFYSMRRAQASKALPNRAHVELVKFAEEFTGSVHLITQNVDHLHFISDPRELLPPTPMHGSLHQSRCSRCGNLYFDDVAYFNETGEYAPTNTELCSKEEKASENYLHQYQIKYADFLPLSPCCETIIRPHIVWFGEIPLHMPKIEKLLRECDLFISIGTSGVVYPAAGFLQVAKNHGATTICINKEKIPQSNLIDHFFEGLASEKVPECLKLLLG